MRVLAQADKHPLFARGRPAGAESSRKGADDGFLESRIASQIQRDSAGTWQQPQLWLPEVMPIYCAACSPSKRGKKFVYFRSLEAWCVHAWECRQKRRRPVHIPPDDCFRLSLDGDRFGGGVWYCSQCPETTQQAQLFGRRLETARARRVHYSRVHDGGAVFALPDCSAEFRSRIEASRQTEALSGRGSHYDTDSESEDHMAFYSKSASNPCSGSCFLSGAGELALSAPDGMPQRPFAAGFGESGRRSPTKLRNCSLQEAAQRRYEQEYAELAAQQVKAYVNGLV